MAKTNDVDVELYSDGDWLSLSLVARWTYVWAFTNHRCNMAGIYKVALQTASIEVGCSEGDMREALVELEAENYVRYDAQRRLLWVRSRAKHIRGQNDNIAKAIVRTLRDLPAGHPFGAAFFAEYSDGSWGQGAHKGALADRLREAAEERPDWLDETLAQPFAGRNGSGATPLFAATTAPPGESNPSKPLRNPAPTESLSKGSGAGGGAITTENDQAPSREPAREAPRVVRHDRRVVPTARVELAERLLATFNEAAGTNYGAYDGRDRPSDNLKRILSALATHPDVSEEQWATTILWRLTAPNPFWDGRPTTGVVFGPKVVSGNLENALAVGKANGSARPQRRRSASERTLAAYAQAGRAGD